MSKDTSNLTAQADITTSAPKAKRDMYGSNWKHSLAGTLGLNDGYFG